MGYYRVYQAKGNKCTYCGGIADTIDHVIPKSKGGTNELSNLVPACYKCNHTKGDRDLSEFLKERAPKELAPAPKPNTQPLKQDYYRMTLPELDKAIETMRAWFWKYPKHEQSQRVMFALTVACAAKEVLTTPSVEPWVDEAVAIFTELPQTT